ncbi:DNA polymerase III subunit delta [Candidatus Saccharibacteria bacterium]|jgi:DNA polymerase-3 subunit delta|nr:DNA polymerase III subunit delta [Candidatus Saccharibacteria bacterium]
MIITLTGSNSFLLLRRLDQLQSDFIKEHGELAVERIDALAAEPQAIIDALQSLPFLASKKLVIVRELGNNKYANEKIEQIIDSAAASADLIIYEPSPDKRTAYFKTLKSKTQLEEFEELDGRKLASWLVDEATNMGGRISLGDANYLIDRVGLNQSILASELEKLLTYNEQISRESIELLTEKTPQSKIFDLLDATFAGNKKRALALYEEQRAQRVEPQAILALITWQLHLLALAKYGTGKTPGQIAKDAKVNPYPVTKAQNLAKKITAEKLAELVNEAAQIDYESKISAVDIDEALKNFVIAI